MSLGWGAQFVRTRVRPEDIPKTAIITPFGLFEFLRMLFGLKNTAQTFQRLMDFVLRDWDFLFVYLNDKVVSKKLICLTLRLNTLASMALSQIQPCASLDCQLLISLAMRSIKTE